MPGLTPDVQRYFAGAINQAAANPNSPPQFDPDKLAAVADLTNDAGSPGIIANIEDSRGVVHHLSQFDCKAAGCTFDALTIRRDSATRTTVVGVDLPRARQLQAQGVLGSVPATAAPPAVSASGGLTPRTIHLNGGTDVQVYGTFPPKVEAALADGWLSQLEQMDLRLNSCTVPAKDARLSDAVDLMQTLNQHYFDLQPSSSGAPDHLVGIRAPLGSDDEAAGNLPVGNQISEDDAKTWQSVQTLPNEAGDASFLNKRLRFQPNFDSISGVPPGPEGGFVQSPAVFNLTQEIGVINRDTTTAPDDQSLLRRKTYLQYLAGAPKASERPADMPEMPTLTRKQVKQAQELLTSGSFQAIRNFCDQVGLKDSYPLAPMPQATPSP